MAGSYKHIVNKSNQFIGIDLIDHLGDAHEALEECYELIKIMSGGDQNKIYEAYIQYLKNIQSDMADKISFDDFWGDE